MLAYRIEDMTCGGCVRAISAAVARVAPTATVHADVAARSVRVEGSDDSDGIGAAIAAAGFDAVPAQPTVPEARVTQGGCGSGGCRCGG